MDTLQILLGLVVFMLMLGMGAALTVDAFRAVVRHWRAPLIGLICQVVIMPLVALGFAQALQVNRLVGLSAVLVGCVPGGSTSNIFTYWSKGDLPLSISMTAISSVLSLGTLPLLLLIYAPIYTTADLQIDFGSVAIAIVLVIVPVLIGMAVKHYAERVAYWLERVGSGAGAVFILAAIVYGSISSASIWESDWKVWLLSVFLLPLGAGSGYGLAALFGFPPRQCRTIALETGIQNSTLAIAVLAFSFPVREGDEESKTRQAQLLQMPLLYSLFLIIDAIILTLVFRFVLSRYDPPDAQVAGGGDSPTASADAETIKSSASTASSDVELIAHTSSSVGGEGGGATPSFTPAGLASP